MTHIAINGIQNTLSARLFTQMEGNHPFHTEFNKMLW